MNSAVTSAKPRAAHSPAWRYLRAFLFAVIVAGLCVVAVRLTSKKVRDLNADELRAQMESGELKVDTAIAQINRMDFDDRRGLMQSPEAQHYFQNLPPQDRKRLVIDTLDKSIRLQIERFHKLSAGERKEFIDEMRQRQIEERERFLRLPKEEQDKRRAMMVATNFEEIVEKAVQAYLSVSTSQERAELAPLYEGALDNARFIKGR